jgi:O-antigen/teichoic acid export membrane protein
VSFYGLSSGEGWQGRFVEVGRWLIFTLGTAAVGISLFGRDVLTLMVPGSYYPPMLLLPVLVFGYFLREVGDFFNSMLLIGIGSGLVGRIALAGAVLNMALNAALIPHFGIWGAAWATFGTWAAYCAIAWVFAWRVHGVTMAPWPLGVMLALSGCVLWLQAVLAPSSPVLRLAADCGLFALFLGLACVAYLGARERRQMFALARKGVLF